MPTETVDPQTGRKALRFRGGATLRQYQATRFVIPLVMLPAAFDDDLSDNIFFICFSATMFLVSAFIARPNGSSVTIDGDRLRVCNPIRQYEFLIRNVTVKDTTFLGGRPGATAIIDVNGTSVLCFGLGRSHFPRSGNDLAKFKETICERGGQVHDRRPVRICEDPVNLSARQQW